MSNDNHEAKQRRRRGTGGIYKQKKKLNGSWVEGPFWWVSYHAQGVQHRESCGSTDRTVAEKLLSRRLAEAAGGKRVILPRAEKLTLGELLDDLEVDYRHKGNRSTIDRTRRYLTGFFGEGKKVLAITRAEIQKYIAARKAVLVHYEGKERPLSNASVNRELACLQRAFLVAVENRKLGHDHLPGKIPMLPEAEPRQGFVEPRDFERLHAALPRYLRLPIRFLYATGWRKDAMRTREWERDCELRRAESGAIIGGILFLDRGHSKNKEPWSLPISGELLEIIRAADEQRDAATPLIFHHNGSRIGDFNKAWKSACKAAGMPGLLVHDLRRSRIRNLIRSGVSETVAMRVSGHKTRSVFQRYNITAHEDLEDALIRSQAYDAAKLQARERKPAQVIAIKQRLRSA